MLDAESETVFSLAEAMPEGGAARPAPLGALRPAALILDGARLLCFIRRFSGGGAVLHLDAPAAVGAPAVLELAGGQALPGTVGWRRGADLGIAFDRPVDVFAIIACDLVGQPGERRRMPRVALSCAAAIETAGWSDFASLSDISEGGARIVTGAALAPGESLLLTPEGFRSIAATVRWTAGHQTGLQFAEPIGWQALMPWLKALRQPPTPAPDASRPEQHPCPRPARIREGTQRWHADLVTLGTDGACFDCFSPLASEKLLWLMLPGLEGWPMRIAGSEGYRFTAAFMRPLHPAIVARLVGDPRQ